MHGGVLLAVGYGLLASSEIDSFYYGLTLIIIGDGFFIPNMAGIVGKLYEGNDPRRDGGFSMLYAAINLGALIPPLIIAYIIFQFGWHVGFILASIIILFGTVIFIISSQFFSNQENSNELKIIKKLQQYFLVALGLLLLIPCLSELIKVPKYSTILVIILGSIFLLFTFKKTNHKMLKPVV